MTLRQERPRARVAGLALALAILCATTAQGNPKTTGIDLAFAARNGVDLKAPVELVFEWRTAQPSATTSIEAITQLLAKNGFAVTVTREQTAPPVTQRHSITGRRTAVTRQAEIDALAAQLAPLVAGSGETRWSLSQQK